MKYIILSGMLLATVALSGCLSDSSASNTTSGAPNTAAITTPVSFSSVAKGNTSSITSQRFEVLLDDALFSSLWSAHVAGASVAPTQPAVDFSKDMVIAAFLGQRATGGYGIEIINVDEQTESIVVTVKGSLPGTTCIVTQAFTQPYHFITVPRSSKPIAFITTIERVNC